MLCHAAFAGSRAQARACALRRSRFLAVDGPPTTPLERGRDQPVSRRPASAHSHLGPVTWLKRCEPGRRGGADAERTQSGSHRASASCAWSFCVVREWGAGARMRTEQRARVGRCLGWASAGNGVAGVAAPCSVRDKRPGALFPHRRDRKALLHRGNPRRDHGHRSGGARVDRALSCPQDAVGLSARSGTLRTPDGDRASSAPCLASREPRSVGAGRTRRVVTALSVPQGTTAPKCGINRRRSSYPRPPAWACMWR